MRALLRLGAKPSTTYLLTTRGRRSGRPRTTPVTLVEQGDQRWLVAPYGAVGWVHNARAAGRVTLTRGHHTETVRIAEIVDPLEAAPILKLYLQREPITRPFFDASPDAAAEAFAAETDRHPVFRVLDEVANDAGAGQS